MTEAGGSKIPAPMGYVVCGSYVRGLLTPNTAFCRLWVFVLGHARPATGVRQRRSQDSLVSWERFWADLPQALDSDFRKMVQHVFVGNMWQF